MLRMYETPGGDVCQIHGKKFVNDRLIQLMEDVIAEYVQMEDASYMDRITSSADWEKPLAEIIDLERLERDEAFVTEWLDVYALVPETVGPRRALHDFFSLYRLLKAKNEYKPDLSMEYILYHVMMMELDFCEDMPETHQQVMRIPEPIRSEMIRELTEEAKEIKEGDSEVWVEDIPEIVDDLMASYEDLDKYVETCFEDTDFLFLDDMDEEEMEQSGFAQDLGVNIRGDEAQVRIQGQGQDLEFKVHAWDLEDLEK